MGQEVMRSFGLYSMFVMMNEMYSGGIAT